MVLGAAGVLPRWPGLVHAVALPPLDLFFDLRVLFTESPSWLVFALGLAAVVLVRSAVLAAMLHGLSGAPGRPWRFWPSALLFELVLLIPLSLAASLTFAGLAALYHWFVWVGLGLALLSGFLAAGAPVSAVLGAGGPASFRRGSIRTLRRGFFPGTFLIYILVLAGLGAGARAMGDLGGVFLLPVSAVVTGLALRRMTVVAGRPPRGPFRRRAVAAAAMVPPLLFGSPPVRPVQGAPSEAIVFMVPGVDTETGRGVFYTIAPARMGFSCDDAYYFSYRGPASIGVSQGEAVCPIRRHAPYTKADTQRPLTDLVGSLGAQIRSIREVEGPRPIVVVTHSQGGWIAWRAITEGAVPGATALAMLATHPDSFVSYPAPNEYGTGRPGADAMRGIIAILDAAGLSSYRPDRPLSREILARAGSIASIYRRSLPAGVRAANLFALYDVAVTPDGWEIPGVENVGFAKTHVGILSDEGALDAVRRLASGRPFPGSTPWIGVLQAVAPAFGPPPA